MTHYDSLIMINWLIKAASKSENEILVNHVESQKRMIQRLEGDIDVIVEQHKHFLDQVKMKQVG